MKLSLTWKEEEEGVAVFRQFGKEFCRIFVYATEEGTAELLLGPSPKLEALKEKAVSKLRKCIVLLDTALKKDGFTEYYFVAEERSPAAGIFHALDLAGEVERAYSEFMLKRIPKKEEGIKEQNLSIEQSEQEILCTRADEEGLFSCRIRPYRDGCYIYGVSVREDMRGKGIGTAAMKELLARIDELPTAAAMGGLYLQVGSYNKPAMRLYQGLDFKAETEFVYYRRIPGETRKML